MKNPSDYFAVYDIAKNTLAPKMIYVSWTSSDVDKAWVYGNFLMFGYEIFPN